MEKILPQERTRHKIWSNTSSKYLYLHLNELNELLLGERLDEEIRNSKIMRYNVEFARRNRRDSLYLIILWSRRIIWMLLATLKIWSANIIWNGKEIYAYSFPKSTKIKTICYTLNSLNTCKIVMWITCQYSNLMSNLWKYDMRLIKIWYIINISIWNNKSKGFSDSMRI